jgi:hypothetical protein
MERHGWASAKAPLLLAPRLVAAARKKVIVLALGKRTAPRTGR